MPLTRNSYTLGSMYVCIAHLLLREAWLPSKEQSLQRGLHLYTVYLTIHNMLLNHQNLQNLVSHAFLKG